jgi:hypothetical protein
VRKRFDSFLVEACGAFAVDAVLEYTSLELTVAHRTLAGHHLPVSLFH